MAVTAVMSALAREKRSRGAGVGVGELLAAERVLVAVNPADPRQARAALSAALCSDHSDLERFRAAWVAVFGGSLAALAPTATVEFPYQAPDADLGRLRGDAGDSTRPAAASAIEVLRRKDFAEYTLDDRARAALSPTDDF